MIETINLLTGTVDHAAGGPPWGSLPAVTLPENLVWSETNIAGARLVRSGNDELIFLGGFKVIRGWKFEGEFTSTSGASNQFYLAGVNTGEQTGTPGIMSQNDSSPIVLGANVIDDEFPAVNYPLTGFPVGSITELGWSGFVLSLWGIVGSGTKDVTIPDGYLTTAEIYISDIPNVSIIEQPSGTITAGDTFSIRMRAAIPSDDERMIGAYFSLNTIDLIGAISIDSPGTQQTDANGEIVWNCTALEDAPTVEGTVFISPLPFSSDVLPGRYVPRTDVPLYGYQEGMSTILPIDLSIEGTEEPPAEGCFWDGIVNAREDCGEVTPSGNLLCDPANWEFDASNGVGPVSSPPDIWNAEAGEYTFDSDGSPLAPQPIMSLLTPGPGTVQCELYVDPSSYFDEFVPYSLEVRNNEYELLGSYELEPGTSHNINVPADGGVIFLADQYFSYPVLFFLTPTC